MRKALVFTAAVCLCAALGACAAGGFAAANPKTEFEIFKQRKMRLPEGEKPVCLTAVGDIMLSRGVAQQIAKEGDAAFPFLKILPFLSGDILTGNLEDPIVPGAPVGPGEMSLRADPGVEQGLKNAGFNLLTLANNHVLDRGSSGALSTLHFLDAAQIANAGAGEGESAYDAKVLTVRGIRIAFLAFVDTGLAAEADEKSGCGPAVWDPQKMQAAVQSASEKADFVVVSLHAGAEYAPLPDAVQVDHAHLAVDAGADLVLGSHPHVVQRAEIYRGKYILYSLGNFVFDQMWSEPTREGLAAKIFITSRGVEKIVFLPVYINDRMQPEVIRAGRADVVAEKLELQLRQQTIPIWDSESHEYAAAKAFVFQPDRPVTPRRLRQEQNGDLDGDGTFETYRLCGGRLTASTGTTVLWRTPAEWWVDSFALADANNDGRVDLNLSVWKSGSFGPEKPFWIKRDDPTVKNHLFIFDKVGNKFKPVWQSSNLDRPILEMTFADLDVDGRNELLVDEGTYTYPPGERLTVWRWDVWGFFRQFP